ncbi:WD40 repeat-containing protein [Mycoavidus cysteinexigens]|uniref:WD40 repeat-containing protein n=1 Tax=Mycoavidus cysteinexigens TaxID=1553431 RepID=A0A2Z6ESW1_9BURK|nr:WD40 repeat-containing protein [Mycoavidus cysteinexigens]GLR02239.1 hypothetical protein GCM10007934_20550 [Mycoavidus cysteinexigens]
MHAWIEASKDPDAAVTVGAANAVTILVRAGAQFNRADLRGIRIPGADLSCGVFDSAQLQGSDLSGVKFRTSWLRQANLSGAQMSGVQFGEWAYLEEESGVYSCAYSPDGKTCAMGLESGEIRVYDTSSWTKIHTLKGHTDPVKSVVYSPSGEQIASGSWDSTVRLWDVKSGSPGVTLKGHTDFVRSVVYSPSGLQIASGSYDNTVRLWDVKSGSPGATLKGHTGPVNSVVYSPSKEQIALGSWDGTIRLGEVISGACLREIQMLSGSVYSVAWTVLDGEQYLVTGSVDHSVRQWEILKEPEVYDLKLSWSSGHERLNVKDMLLKGVEGLSEINQKLLTQRGALLA